MRDTDYPGYQVSENGEIWSTKSQKFLAQHIKNGYKTINIKGNTHLVHRLIAKAYIPNNDDNLVVNHKDGNKLNNHYTNLEWITQKENVHHHGKDTSHPRKVIQKSLNGEIVATFNSISEAAASINKDRTTVSRVCNGKNKTAGGYIFEYEDDKHKHQEIDKTVEHKIIKDFPKYLVF